MRYFFRPSFSTLSFSDLLRGPVIASAMAFNQRALNVKLVLRGNITLTPQSPFSPPLSGRSGLAPPLTRRGWEGLESLAGRGHGEEGFVMTAWMQEPQP